MNGGPNTPPSGETSRARRFGNANPWLIGALAVSLALNAFVLGAVVGERWRDGERDHYAHSHKHHYGRGHVPGHSIRHLGAMLDADARRKLRRAARPHRARMKLLLADAAEARLDALDAMSARDFDPETLEAAFARSREAEAAATKLTQQIIAEAAAQFTPEERAAVHTALEQRMELWRERVDRRRKRLERWQKRLEREPSGDR